MNTDTPQDVAAKAQATFEKCLLLFLDLQEAYARYAQDASTETSMLFYGSEEKLIKALRSHARYVKILKQSAEDKSMKHPQYINPVFVPTNWILRVGREH